MNTEYTFQHLRRSVTGFLTCLSPQSLVHTKFGKFIYPLTMRLLRRPQRASNFDLNVISEKCPSERKPRMYPQNTRILFAFGAIYQAVRRCSALSFLVFSRKIKNKCGYPDAANYKAITRNPEHRTPLSLIGTKSQRPPVKHCNSLFSPRLSEPLDNSNQSGKTVSFSSGGSKSRCSRHCTFLWFSLERSSRGVKLLRGDINEILCQVIITRDRALCSLLIKLAFVRRLIQVFQSRPNHEVILKLKHEVND